MHKFRSNSRTGLFLRLFGRHANRLIPFSRSFSLFKPKSTEEEERIRRKVICCYELSQSHFLHHFAEGRA